MSTYADKKQMERFGREYQMGDALRWELEKEVRRLWKKVANKPNGTMAQDERCWVRKVDEDLMEWSCH